MDGLDGVAGRGIGWLVALTLLIGAAILPASAHAGAGFAFVPDPMEPSLPAGSGLVAVADLTGGGIPDLVIVNGEDNAVGVMLGNGAGGFAAPTWYPVAGHPAFVGVADFNNDGHPDLLVPTETLVPRIAYPNTLPDTVQILFGDGHGNFTSGPPIKLPEAGAVYVGDFTGNGNEDAVVAPTCEARGTSHKYYMLLGDGHGNLTPGPVYESPRSSGCYTFVGDFTGNGRDDLLTKPEGPGEEEAIVVLPGEPDGSFGPPVVTPVPQVAPHGAFLAGVADLDGDGKLDLVLRSLEEPMGRVEIFDGNGTGGFSEVGSYPSEQPTYSFWVALGAFAGEGDVDVATIGSQLSVLTNNGADVLSPSFTTPLGANQDNAFVADVNGDGRPDIILSGPSGVDILLDEPVSPVSASSTQQPSTQQPVAPLVQSVHESAKRWREGEELAQISRTRKTKKPPVGTTFSFSLNEQATVSFSFAQQIAGRKVGYECVGKSKKNAKRKACKRGVVADTFSFTGHAGKNTVVFQGRVSYSKKLVSGRYTLAITATNSAGASAPQSLSFTIVK